MRTLATRTLIGGLIAAGVLAGSLPVQAQQKKPEGQSTVFYSQYEPSQRQRLRRESCAMDELSIGPYCTKKCEAGYLLVGGSKPPRCKSIEPLPPGQMPTAVRRQTGVQPPPPGPREPVKKGNGQG